jgi:hypothetical protein
MTFVLGVGYVCAECRRNLSSATRRGDGVALAREQKRRTKFSAVRGLRSQTSASTPLVRSDDNGGGGGEGRGRSRGGVQIRHELTGEEEFPDSRPFTDPLDTTLLPLGWEAEEVMVLSEPNPHAFSRLLEEADLAPPAEGKLVDRRGFSPNFALWRLLLVFRKRMHGDLGVREVWEGMRRRKLSLPVEGKDADAIWGIFASTALRDREFCEEWLKYAEDISNCSNHQRQWTKLYDEVMLRVLVNQPEEALGWHWRLFPVFVSRSWGKLFLAVLEKRGDCPRLHRALRMIHATLRDPGLYEDVIRTLCEMELQERAIVWHRHFLANCDLPEDSGVLDGLISWTARNSTIGDLRALFQSVKAAGVPLCESSAVAAVKGRKRSNEAVKLLFSDTIFPPSTLGDMFWSTLFSLTLTSKQVFEHAMIHAGNSHVGALTLERVVTVLGIDPPGAVEVLRLAGLIFSPSSSAPPPQTTQPEFGAEPGSHEPEAQNAHLQHLLSSCQHAAALRFLAHLRSISTSLDPDTVVLLAHTLLRPRKPGKNPTTKAHIFAPGKDLDFTIPLFLSLRTAVPPTVWNGIFRRLGMAGRLEELEGVMVKLVEIYRAPGVPRISKEHPWRKLFTATVQRAVVEWGWIYAPAGKRMWGIRLVRRLRRLRVWVDRRSVRRAVRVRVARELTGSVGGGEHDEIMEEDDETGCDEEIMAGGGEEAWKEVKDDDASVVKRTDTSSSAVAESLEEFLERIRGGKDVRRLVAEVVVEVEEVWGGRLMEEEEFVQQVERDLVDLQIEKAKRMLSKLREGLKSDIYKKEIRERG